MKQDRALESLAFLLIVVSLLEKKKLTLKKLYGPFYGPFLTASKLEPLRGGSSQKFLVLILSTSGGWKAESTLEPPSGFENGTSGLGIQRLNH